MEGKKAKCMISKNIIKCCRTKSKVQAKDSHKKYTTVIIVKIQNLGINQSSSPNSCITTRSAHQERKLLMVSESLKMQSETV